MDETQAPRRKTGVVWLLLLVALIALYWYFTRGAAEPEARRDGATDAELAADRAAPGADPDDILVDLRDDATDAQLAAIERDLGIDLTLVSAESYDERFYRAHVDPARQASLLAALSRRPEVEIAEADLTMSIPAVEVAAPPAPGARWEGYPDDPKYKFQWHLDQIHMPEAWKLAQGEGVVVAVLDTGVAYEAFEKYHQVEDLAGVEFVSPYDFVGNDRHANDDHGHGTHVAGTIAQATHNGKGVAGVAVGAKIMPLRVLGADGSGSVAGIADAIRYAADNGAKVINMSLGGPLPSRVLKKACEYAHKKGVTIVAAAGNESRTKVGYPAGYPGVIAVSATQLDEATTFYSNSGKDVDIAAPGGNTRVDQNGDGMPDGVLQNTIAIGDPTKSDYFPFMGTSMASPHVAGVAALVVGAGVTDPVEVERVLTESARRPNAQTYVRDRYGAGIVDAAAAVKLAKQRAGQATARAGDDAGAQGTTTTHGVLAGVLGLLMAGAVASMRRRVMVGGGYLLGAVAGAVALVVLPANALVASALAPLALLSVGWGVRALRAPLAGVAAGVAAGLLLLAVARIDVAWVPGVFGFDPIWLGVNALVCVGLARAALRP